MASDHKTQRLTKTFGTPSNQGRKMRVLNGYNGKKERRVGARGLQIEGRPFMLVPAGDEVARIGPGGFTAKALTRHEMAKFYPSWHFTSVDQLRPPLRHCILAVIA